MKKELILLFSTPVAYVAVGLWLLASSLLLWVFGGEYNLAEGGYATLRPFFVLTPHLLLGLVPALTMRSWAEERRTGTLELLLFRPVRLSRLIAAKYAAVGGVLLLGLALTGIYAAALCRLSLAGIDGGETAGGYIGLLLLCVAWTAMGMFASSLTDNALVAFLLAFALAAFGYYGWDLLASLTPDGAWHNALCAIGMHEHYRSLMRGVVDSRDVLYFLALALLFLALAHVRLSLSVRRSLRRVGMLAAGLLAAGLLSTRLYLRADLTADRRYTLSPTTRLLASGLERPLHAVLYLGGDLNPAFDRLRTATLDLLDETAAHVPGGITLHEVNPSAAPSEAERMEAYRRLSDRGLEGLTVGEHGRDGRTSTQVVFPWLELAYGADTLAVPLLQKNPELSAQQVLNTSIGDLEYRLADALRVLTTDEPSRIAFIEGHGEWDEPYVYEAVRLLSRYYHVDRGHLDGDLSTLLPYRVLIVAGARTAFTEAEKFLLDQYLMQGGSLLFLLDGVRIDEEAFARTGESATLKNETNLDDLLFTYGVRINPVVVQDMNCIPIRLTTALSGGRATQTTAPWYFAPLLEPSADHPIGSHLPPLRSELASTLTWVGTDTTHVRRTVLLRTSEHARTLPVPEMVSLRYVEMPADEAYFPESSLPVAGLLEGEFPSAFRHRVASGPMRTHSQPARLAVCASASLVRNEWRGQGRQSVPLPLGYEPVSGETLGNADFLAHVVDYLAGNERWLSMRLRHVRLRLLDAGTVAARLPHLRWLCTLLPLILLGLSGLGLRRLLLRR